MSKQHFLNEPAAQNKFFLLDLERTIQHGTPHYWKAHRRGYTPYLLMDAGLFTAAEALDITNDDIDNRTIAVPVSTVKKIIGV